MKKNLFHLIGLVVAGLLLHSCGDKDTDGTLVSNEEALQRQHTRSEIFEYMSVGYLWYNKIPKNVDTLEDIEPTNFFYSLLYNSLDKWSFMVSKQEMDDLENGVYFGHGIMFNYDEYGKLRVAFVFKNTSAWKAGIRRGWILERANGQTVLNFEHLNEILGDGNTPKTNQFDFINLEGIPESIPLTKEIIQANPVLESKVIDYAGNKVGYLALESFMGNDIESKLDTIFMNFNASNINELVIDLRYNSGGNLTTANHLANLALGNSRNDFQFISLTFNDKLESLYPDSVKKFYYKRLPNSLKKRLTRIFFITSGNTASASEALIMGLKNYVNTLIIGTRTYGKPVGMIPIELESSNDVIVPVMFEWKNAEGQSCGYSGIGVDYAEFDDLTRELGEISELCLRQALRYISTGTFPAKKKSAEEYNAPVRNLRGIRAEIGAY